MIKKLLPYLLFIIIFAQAPKAHATYYYIDFVNGNDANTGLGTTTGTAWLSLNKFMASARTSGDVAFVRRGQATTTGMTTVTVTSSGSAQTPIIVEADYDNLWSDFASSSQTYTVTTGSTTLTASAGSDITAGKWIYVQNDCFETATTSSAFGFNTCQYAYEVANVSGTAIQLYIPYQGNNAGSGKNVRIMGANPQFGRNSSSNQATIAGKSHWVIKGIDWRDNGTFLNFTTTPSQNWLIYDCDVNVLSFSAGSTNGAGANTSVIKTRIGTTTTALINDNSGAADMIYSFIFDQDYIEMNSGKITTGLFAGTVSGYEIRVTRSYLRGFTGLIGAGGVAIINTYLRNNQLLASQGTSNSQNGVNQWGATYIEGLSSASTSIDRNFQFIRFNSSSSSLFPLESTTTVTRSGGGPVSIRVAPNAATLMASSSNPSNILNLFEYPIYANTTSKTYTMYFMSTSTTAWTTNPLATELWIECEEIASPVGVATSTWGIVRSTSTLNFTGSTAWQSLAVTCAPSQSGMLYLRGWFGKVRDTGKQNEFYVDGTPVIN